ncbi:MAG TPA: kelch repeat-containing protein [Solirubrobacterales bacterium]
MKVLACLLAALSLLLGGAVLAYADVIDLPGNWRTTLGFQEETPNPPCRPGLYRRDPASPAPAPGSWRFEPEAPRAQVEGAAAAIGPVIYVAGGNAPGNMHRVLSLDTRTGSWNEPAQLPVGLNHTAAETHDGKLYLAGGFLEGEAETALFLEYDPAADEWTEMPPMGRARGGAAAAVVGDELYVVDGGPQPYGVEEPRPPYAHLEAFDFRTGTWSVKAPPPVGVHHVEAAPLDGKIYMAGGRTDEEESSAAFLRYDPASDRWTRLPSLPEGKISSLGAVPAGGKIVVFGGDDEENWEEGGGFVSPTAWAFDPDSRRWTRLPDLHVERHAFGAAVVGDRVYAIAGSICPGLKPGGAVPTHTVESLRVPPGRN